MSDSKSGMPKPSGDGRLRSALEVARDQQAVRFDAIEEVRALDAARLQALADDLEAVFDDVPQGHDLFICQVVPGDPPRLWVDLLSYVAMDDDGRTYRFVMNGRSGREILAESSEISEISGHVVAYIAHRIIDIERAGAGPLKQALMDRHGGYSATAVALAWACGFAVGGLVLLALAVVIYGGP